MNTLLNDILGLTIGNESTSYSVQTEYDEMLDEIATESAVDDCFLDEYTHTGAVATAAVESLAINIAENDIRVGSKDPSEVYASFGLEAAKDVVARKAYMAWAGIKALFKAIIGWFKKLLGIETNFKKIRKSLAKKAKAAIKELSKIVPKHKEDVTKEMLNYSDLLDKLAGQNTSTGSSNPPLVSIVNATNAETRSVSDIKDAIEDLFDDKDDYEDMKIREHIMKGLRKLTTANDGLDDVEKHIKNMLKRCDKAYGIVDKIERLKDGGTLTKDDVTTIYEFMTLDIAWFKTDGAKDTGGTAFSDTDDMITNLKDFGSGELEAGKAQEIREGLTTSLNTAIKVLTKQSSAMGQVTKAYVKVADYLFTDVKWYMAKFM